MGLSRNKVAVSEGAAGSPPFYGEHEELSRGPRIQDSFRKTERWSADTKQTAELIVVQFSVTERLVAEIHLTYWRIAQVVRARA